MISASFVAGALAFPATMVTIVVCVLQAMHSSVGIAAPTSTQMQEEDLGKCALFRHVPVLKRKLAWRQLGTFPTPIHKGSCAARPISRNQAKDSIATPATTKNTESSPSLSTSDVGADTVTFFIKREDLSSPVYGGNKVRTLQHQLAIIEAKVEQGTRKSDLVVFGSGGSNQVVATVVHALRTKILIPTMPLWMADPPDLDNALNMLSTLSFPLGGFCTWGDKSNPFTLIFTLLDKLLRGKSFVFPLGGNTPAGVLGQAGGALELAEQIEAGEIPDCDGIYLAVGSSCTISGLILGVALARRVGLKAFSKPGFALHPVLIHDVLALLHRNVGLYKMALSCCVPLTIRHSLYSACGQLKKMGGPDVLDEALAILQHETTIHDDAFLTGRYGVHSEPSRACARLFDSSAHIADLSGETSPAPDLWLCGHFTAKAMAVMCDDLLKVENKDKDMLFWQTKSSVQPLGDGDEWEQMQAMPPAVKKWAQAGQAESEKRRGKIDLIRGSANGYRGLMTDVSEL